MTTPDTTRRVRARFWIQAVLSAAAFVLLALTLITREWIEALTGWDPDHGNGAVEWAVVAVLAVLAIGFGLSARQEWKRPREAPQLR